MKNKKIVKAAFLAVSLIVLTVAIGFYLNFRFCGFADEMKAYGLNHDPLYYYGPRYCPATWEFRSLDVDEVSELETEKSTVVLSKKESPELEKALEKKYLSFTRFFAENQGEKFVIYEMKGHKTDGQECED